MFLNLSSGILITFTRFNLKNKNSATTKLIIYEIFLIYLFSNSGILRKSWEEPCVVFCPHWSMRLGPAVHLLQRWCGDPNSLLIIEVYN